MKIHITEKDIQKRVNEIGKELSTKYREKSPIIIGVLNGSFIFLADLVRSIKIDCKVDFIKLKSYDGPSSTGEVNLVNDISLDIENEHIIVVEDIIDTGLTLDFLISHFINLNPASISIATLLFKNTKKKIKHKVDYIGFDVDDEFVIGYGMDLNQEKRNLPSIYKINI